MAAILGISAVGAALMYLLPAGSARQAVQLASTGALAFVVVQGGRRADEIAADALSVAEEMAKGWHGAESSERPARLAEVTPIRNGTGARARHGRPRKAS
jgi:hypothetical protein